MKRRCGLLLVVAFWAGASGCSSTARRTDGSPIFGPKAWNEAPAPPQKLVAAAPARSADAEEPAARPDGLARYFPALRRTNPEPPKVATRHRPTWFGLRPNPNKVVGTQTYMTDARAGLNRPGAEPTALPVALQVPSERGFADRAVTPTNAESIRPATAPRSTGSEDSSTPPGRDLVASSTPGIPDFGGKPSRPGEDEVNPLPPAAEPNAPAAVASRMPELPTIDPRERPTTPGPEAKAEPVDVATQDEQAVKAATPPVGPDPLDSTQPVSYSTEPTTQVAEASKGPAPAPETTVSATPQTIPPKPHTHVKPSAVKPTSQVKPSPQSEAAPASHAWKRPCLRRLIRKVCKLGEYANPPTAAPH